MEIHFVSDTHFGHANIIGFCDRPFSNTQEMDEYMVQKWNERVKPQDHVYHLGDVTIDRGGRAKQEPFIKLIRSLNGHKRLLLGNHDHFPVKVYLEAGFEKVVGTGRWIENLLLSHYPVHGPSIGRAAACVHGHIHQQPPPKPFVFKEYDTVWNEDSSHLIGNVQPYINVCVEHTAYAPITLEEVKSQIRKVINEFSESCS